MTLEEFMEVETEEGATFGTLPTCHRCHEEKHPDELTFCSNGNCEHDVCSRCQSEAAAALEVCSDRCASEKIASLQDELIALRKQQKEQQKELNGLRAQASTAAAIMRRFAAAYVMGERKVA